MYLNSIPISSESSSKMYVNSIPISSDSEEEVPERDFRKGMLIGA